MYAVKFGIPHGLEQEKSLTVCSLAVIFFFFNLDFDPSTPSLFINWKYPERSCSEEVVQPVEWRQAPYICIRRCCRVVKTFKVTVEQKSQRVTQEDSVYLCRFCETVALCQYLLTWVLLLVIFMFIMLMV